MTNAELVTYLKNRRACEDAMAWLGGRDLATAWRECERADWLLWLIGPVIPRQDLVLIACACARMALKYVSIGETRPLLAIEAAEAWARGQVTIDDVRKAADATYADAAYAAATYAAYAAATYAAYTAYYAAATYAAYAAATYAAYAAYYYDDDVPAYAAAADAYADAAYAAAHKQMCELIREKWPICPLSEEPSCQPK